MESNVISILDESMPVLIRESLSDHGNQTHMNQSPDIIVRKFKLENPLEDFIASYDSDVSQDGDGSGQMYIYVRFKNISDKILSGFYIHLYRNHFGLCNAPSDWAQYEMKTEYNHSAYIASLNPGEIGVTPPFIYDSNQVGANPNCFVAVATQKENPDYSSINSSDKYIKWIDKSNVAARNVHVSVRGVCRSEQHLCFDNPSRDQKMLAAFKIKVEESTSSGIRYGIIHQDLGINNEKTYFSGDSNSSEIYCLRTIPAGYKSTLLLWYECLEDQKVHILPSYYKCEEVEQERVLFDRYGIDLRKDFCDDTEIASKSMKPMRAIMLGACSIKSGV